MNTNVADFDKEAKLRQIDQDIQAELDGLDKDIDSARTRWLNIGERLLQARQIWRANQDFGEWCDRRSWAARLHRNYRAAALKLAFNRKRVEATLPMLKTEAVAPNYLLKLVEDAIAAFGAEPLLEVRDIWSSSTIVEDDDQVGDPPAALQNPAPEPPKEAQSPEQSCEKKPSDDNDVPELVAVSVRNAALERWGELGATILKAFSNPNARTVWNQLAAKRHGIEVAKFALDYFERGHVPLPTNACVFKPNARLVLPWLNSPFADEYDLGKAAGFEKLKADLDVIERICRPVFATRQRDKGNQCFTLFRREMNRPNEEALAARVEALTQRDRKAVNVQNHPPIKVYGVELWPDGDLPENLRLTYDAARWAYFLWRDHEAFFTRAEQNVNERGAFWQSRQRSLHDLKFPVGEALSYFWWRCGEAMRKHPDAHRECYCQPMIRVK